MKQSEERLIYYNIYVIVMGKPFLYDAVNSMYHSVMDNMPDALRERSMASAFLLGAAGIYLAVKGLQWISREVISSFSEAFDERLLPGLEKACVAGMAGAPILYALIDPQGARDMVANHETYASGMAGVYVGSIAGALQDLHKRSKQKLEDSL